jgi:hypothetical protein
MFSTDPATTRDLPLAEVAERLARKTRVQALMTIGSSRNALQPAYSDYDLVIVLEGWPAEVRVGYTIIGSKLTDLLFVESAAITRILSAVEPLDPWNWDGRMVRWLQAGRILFDRHGAVTRAQAKVQAGEWVQPPNAAAAYRAWFQINYNLSQTRRMLAADDPVYGYAIDIRLLYMVAECITGYFALRGLLWEGEKAAIRYFQNHESEYLTAFTRCIHANDRVQRFRLYEDLARRTLEPVGGVWGDGQTVFAFDGDADEPAACIETARCLWTELVTDSETPETHRRTP